MSNPMKYTEELIDNLIMESKNPMNTLGLNIPFSYAEKAVHLNWNDVLFLLKYEYFSEDAVIEFAVSQLEDQRECDEAVYELACLKTGEMNREELLSNYIIQLSNKVPVNEHNETQEKMLYLILKGLFDNREHFADPLRILEIVYDDFGFPAEIQNLIRYMPSEHPEEMNCEKNIYCNWKKYLNNKTLKFRTDDVIRKTEE